LKPHAATGLKKAMMNINSVRVHLVWERSETISVVKNILSYWPFKTCSIAIKLPAAGYKDKKYRE
jgi:hypothetical protein